MDGVMRVSYDPKVEELAQFSLTTETIQNPDPETVNRLAGLIQQLIENFIEYEM
jgi:hypothetical protein